MPLLRLVELLADAAELAVAVPEARHLQEPQPVEARLQAAAGLDVVAGVLGGGAGLERALHFLLEARPQRDRVLELRAGRDLQEGPGRYAYKKGGSVNKGQYT